MSNIAIIGAGITGVTTAHALLARGHAVTLFERQRYGGMDTSFANGGQLSASNAEAWNSIPTLIKGLKWMLRADAPLLLNPRPSLHKYGWLAEFIGQIRNYRANTIATTRLAIEARAHLFAIAEQEGIDFDLATNGLLHIHRDKAAFDAATRVNALLREAGLDQRAVTPTEMRQIEPTLTGKFYGGYFTQSDSTGDCHLFTQGLADACIRRGAHFIFDTTVREIVAATGGVTITAQGPGGPITHAADAVVICAGIASRAFAAMLGERVNIYPVKGYSITVMLNDPASRAAAPQVGLLDDATKIATSRLGPTRFRVAGTAEFNGETRDIRTDRIRPLTDWVRAIFPDVSTEHAIPWAGLRPMTPSLTPRVGAGKRPGIFYNTGHGHLGWTLSAATAALVAEAVDASLRRNA